MTAPLVMPEVITGLSLLLLFVAMNIDRSLMTVTIAHTTFTMCYVAIVVQSRLLTFDMSLEEAAQDLGCPPVKTFFKITLPLILPAVISGWMLAFTLSLVLRLSAKVKSTAAAQQASGLVSLPLIGLAYGQSSGALFGAQALQSGDVAAAQTMMQALLDARMSKAAKPAPVAQPPQPATGISLLA